VVDLLFFSYLKPIPQAFDLEILSGTAAVDILDVVRGSLEM
jgi:hypothetical protein